MTPHDSTMKQELHLQCSQLLQKQLKKMIITPPSQLTSKPKISGLDRCFTFSKWVACQVNPPLVFAAVNVISSPNKWSYIASFRRPRQALSIKTLHLYTKFRQLRLHPNRNQHRWIGLPTLVTVQQFLGGDSL